MHICFSKPSEEESDPDNYSHRVLSAYLSLLKTVIGMITFLHGTGIAYNTKKFKEDGNIPFLVLK